MKKFTPVHSDSVIERIDFYQDDVKITIVSRFNTSSVFSDEDADVDLDSYDPEQGAEMGVAVGWVDEEPGERISIEVEGDVDSNTANQIILMFEDEGESGVEELGWSWSDRELWFYGPIREEDDETGDVTVYGDDRG
jgi:alpha-L-arabinofuranosidase